MASPFKTHETMDLARALLEQDSILHTGSQSQPPCKFFWNNFDSLLIRLDFKG